MRPAIALIVSLGLAVAACSASSMAAPAPPNVAHRVTIGVASFQPRGATFFGTSWRIVEGQEVYVPIAVDVGCTITGWAANVQKGVAASQLTAALQYAEPMSSAVSLVDGLELSANGQYGALTLSSPEMAHVVGPGADYAIRVARDFTPGSDFALAAELKYECPAL